MEYKIINKIYKIAAVISLLVMAVACDKKGKPMCILKHIRESR